MSTQDDEAAARELIAQGYYQTSRRHRHVCRLPQGQTGIQALARAVKDSRPWDAYQWASRLGEASAGDHYLRVYASNEGNCLELASGVFNAFLRLGGTTYDRVDVKVCRWHEDCRLYPDLGRACWAARSPAAVESNSGGEP